MRLFEHVAALGDLDHQPVRRRQQGCEAALRGSEVGELAGMSVDEQRQVRRQMAQPVCGGGGDLIGEAPEHAVGVGHGDDAHG